MRLDCPGDEDPHRTSARSPPPCCRCLPAGPDLLVVQGDTSSALGAALAGVHRRAFRSRMSRRACGPTIRACPGPRRNIARRSTRTPTCCSRPRNGRGQPALGEVHGRDPRHRQHRRSTRCSPPKAASAAQAFARGSRGCSSPATAAKAGARDSGRSPPRCSRSPRRQRARLTSFLHPNPHVAANAQSLDRPGNIADRPMQPPRARPGCAPPTWCSAIRAGSRKKRRRSARRCSCCATRPNGPKVVASGNARLVGTSAERIVAEVRGCSRIRSSGGHGAARISLRRWPLRAADRGDHRTLARNRRDSETIAALTGNRPSDYRFPRGTRE